MGIVITGTGYISQQIKSFIEHEGNTKVSLLSLHTDNYTLPADTHTVIHVAGITPNKHRTASDFYSINYKKTKLLFNKCKRIAVKRFIYISSMAVYGNILRPEGRPVTLTTKPNPASNYGKSKLLAELYIQKQKCTIIKTIIRVPTLYDSVRKDYFNFFIKIVKFCFILPYMRGETYRSILHIDNLGFLISEILHNDIQSDTIVLPCDAIIPTINDILNKIISDRHLFRIKSYAIGRLVSLISHHSPLLCNFSGNAYYGHDATLISYKSLCDIEL